MEISRIWREHPTNMRFEGDKTNKEGVEIFKYPGGQIVLTGSYEQIRNRFLQKGFNEETTDEILFRLWGGVSAETTISLSEVADRFHELVRSEVRK